MTNIIYLACPYTHPDRTVVEYRVEAVTQAAARLIEKGSIVFSPLTLTHPINDLMLEPQGSDYWVSFDEAFMEHCSEIQVLMLPGWDSSKGIRREMEFFTSRGRKLSYIFPQDIGL